jgi:hypothetical protein
MDELEWLKANSPSIRPSRDVTRRHRTQLRSAIATEGADGSRPRRPHRARPSRVRVLRTGAIVVAACAIGAGVVVLTSTGGGDHPADVGAPASSSSTTTSATNSCGAVPKQLALPAGFGAAVDGTAPQSLTPPERGQQVTHWSSSDTTVEQRWPASADVVEQFGRSASGAPDAGIGAAAQAKSTVDDKGIARRTVVFTFSDQPAACSSLQVTAIGRDQQAVDAAVDAIVLKPFVSTEPLVTTTGASASAPPVVACDATATKAATSDQAAPVAASVGGPVSDAAFAAPDQALSRFLAGHPTLLPSGYQQLTLDDSSIAFVREVQPGVAVTAVHVQPTASGWTVTDWRASGC